MPLLSELANLISGAKWLTGESSTDGGSWGAKALVFDSRSPSGASIQPTMRNG